MITLNLNKLNSIIKTHRMAKEIKKNKTHVYAAYKRLTLEIRRHRLKVKGFHSNGNQKKARVARIISDKIDFKTRP